MCFIWRDGAVLGAKESLAFHETKLGPTLSIALSKAWVGLSPSMEAWSHLGPRMEAWSARDYLAPTPSQASAPSHTDLCLCMKHGSMWGLAWALAGRYRVLGVPLLQ